MTKTVFLTIAGRTNAGKSSLLNTVVGEKIASVSSKSQTTRTRITGIKTIGETQLVFMDTPGLHKPKNKLSAHMLNAVKESVTDIDAVIFMADCTHPLGEQEENMLRDICRRKIPVIFVLNKIDLLDNMSKLAPIIASLSSKFDLEAIVPVSVKENNGIDIVINEAMKLAAESPHFFPDDMITDQPERIIAAEMIREKVLRSTRDEVPHSIAVEIDEFKVRDDIYIRANIFVERESQKGIVIGAKGSLLKKIGEQARKDIESLLGNKVFLDLWVKVKPDWRNKDKALKQFGYEG